MAVEGRFTKKYIPVIMDSLDVVSRLKQIDSSYFVMYNRLSQKFEVHSNKQAQSLCLILPYKHLDARSLTYVRKYRCERAKDIYDEMEKANALTEARKNAKMKDTLNTAYEDLMHRIS